MISPVSAVPDVFVLWHPNCAIGERTARAIYAWLRPAPGLGARVFFRSLPVRDPEPDRERPLPIPLPNENRFGESGVTAPSSLQIVIPLLDANMIADPAWRHWLERIADRSAGARRTILPVGLDGTAFNAPAGVREQNFIKPQTPASGISDLDDESWSVFIQSLVKQLTEALCRLLLGTLDDPGASLKLKIFLSHAKADGAAPARRLRDYIYSKTQLAAFYDENDIAYGSPFAQVLDAEVKARNTVALIAVRTARYASRPWCRREVSIFRKPYRLEDSQRGGQMWRLNPILVVEALQPGTSTAGVPEFGTAPALAWADAPGHEERTVTTLLRDAMLSEIHLAAANAVRCRPGDVLLNAHPDPTTLIQVLRERPREEVTVWYPGHLTRLQKVMLWDLFPDIWLKSFDEVALDEVAA